MRHGSEGLPPSSLDEAVKTSKDAQRALFAAGFLITDRAGEYEHPDTGRTVAVRVL